MCCNLYYDNVKIQILLSFLVDVIVTCLYSVGGCDWWISARFDHVLPYRVSLLAVHNNDMRERGRTHRILRVVI